VAGNLPADNGPYREGKGTLYEGGTRVVALANWRGKLKPGSNNGLIHTVDMMPTLAGLAGADLGKSKPLDGMDIGPVLGSGTSPRSEVVYNVEPMQGAVRQGDWKLYWHAVLPQKVELFNLADDPGEKTDLSSQNAEKTAGLQRRITDLASTMAPPLFFGAALHATLSAPLATPSEEVYFLGDEND
jgi:arylsulfatase I/J